MAAYAALVSLMNDLDDVQNHTRHSFSFDSKQIISLNKTVNLLIDFLESYDSYGHNIDALKNQVTSAARAAHDVIEFHVVGQLQSGSTIAEKLPRSYFLLDLQKAIENMDFVWRKAMQFKAKGGLLKAYSGAAAASTSGKSNMVGFDVVRDQLLDMMTGELHGHRQVIPLVGMGGIGKTTLAKNAYEHFYAKQHFDVRLWATISQQCSVDTILGQLSASSGKELATKLLHRRYLIVLDDMWSLEAWTDIRKYMPDDCNGSCIIVTTRLSNLAAYFSSSPFKMNFLDEDESWELFCGVAFGQEKCPLEFESIGKKIVERCQGLPLSITVIGGHLRKSTRAAEYWEKVASLMNPISGLVDDEQCLKIISLSYHHLPVHLQPCILYQGFFKEDERIEALELVQFWIAAGFLKPKQSLSLEEVAEECLKDLIERNLILVHQTMVYGIEGECYSIHDTVRESLLKLGNKENFMCAIEAIDIGKKHDIVMQRPEWKHGKTIGDLEMKLLARSRVGSGEFYRGLLLDFRFMRCHFQLLNLRHFQFELSYMGGNESLCLLSSISLLWNVKTLIINNRDVISMPYEIWEMPQLRRLITVRGLCLPDPLPNQEECIVLQNLERLDRVIDFKITEEVCNRMPNIKDLSIDYDHFPGDLEAACSYYCPHNLSHFSKLESLFCRFSNVDSGWNGFVLRFTLPSSLLKLTISDCNLHWEDFTTMIKSLHHLEELQLFSLKGSEWNLIEEFPRLKKLKIGWCDDLIYWNANVSHFPFLQNLQIISTPKLSEIPLDIGEIPTMECITLYKCGVHAAISALRIMQEQESLGNEVFNFYVYFEFYQELERFKKMVQEEDVGWIRVERYVWTIADVPQLEGNAADCDAEDHDVAQLP